MVRSDLGKEGSFQYAPTGNVPKLVDTCIEVCERWLPGSCTHEIVTLGNSSTASQAQTDTFCVNGKEDIDPSASVCVEKAAHKELQLLGLPNELLDYIFEFLDAPPPSSGNIIDHPGASWTQSSSQNLKAISMLCHRLRLIVLPRLFRFSRLDPYRLASYLSFLSINKLESKVSSVVAHLQGPCNHIHPAWWCRLLNSVPATRFAIGCAPHIFAELAQVSINCTDSWAFNMPYHFVEFEQTSESAHQHISYRNLPNILTARPWTSLTVNEGSSLAAYTRYEYFLKRPPSLLAALQMQLPPISITIPPEARAPSEAALAQPQQEPLIPAQVLFTNLQSFSFVAIFPFYNHVDNILKCVRRMTKLRKLFIKLCPEPDSRIIDDEMAVALNHIDLNDPWSE